MEKFHKDEVCASMDIDVEQYRVNKDIKKGFNAGFLLLIFL